MVGDGGWGYRMVPPGGGWRFKIPDFVGGLPVRQATNHPTVAGSRGSVCLDEGCGTAAVQFVTLAAVPLVARELGILLHVVLLLFAVPE